MKKTYVTTLTCKLLVGIMTLLGLNSCSSKQALVDEEGRKLTRKERKEIQKRQEAIERSRIEQERIGRVVALYGAPPNMRPAKIAPKEKEE